MPELIVGKIEQLITKSMPGHPPDLPNPVWKPRSEGISRAIGREVNLLIKLTELEHKLEARIFDAEQRIKKLELKSAIIGSL